MCRCRRAIAFPSASTPLIRERSSRQGMLPAACVEEPGPGGAVEPAAGAYAAVPGCACWTAASAPRKPGGSAFPGVPGCGSGRSAPSRAPWRRRGDALERGAGMNLAGGTHHAFADHGEGFCVFNDVAVAIRLLQREGRIRRGRWWWTSTSTRATAPPRIFAGDPDVFTFSMHGARNYPFHKEPSGLDVELPDGCGDAGLPGALDDCLDRLLDRVRPDLVFYLAGADPYWDDRLGRLALSDRRARARGMAWSSRSLPRAAAAAWCWRWRGGYAPRTGATSPDPFGARSVGAWSSAMAETTHAAGPRRRALRAAGRRRPAGGGAARRPRRPPRLSAARASTRWPTAGR